MKLSLRMIFGKFPRLKKEGTYGSIDIAQNGTATIRVRTDVPLSEQKKTEIHELCHWIVFRHHPEMPEADAERFCERMERAMEKNLRLAVKGK